MYQLPSYLTLCVSDQVPDLLHVAAALKDHAAHVGDSHSSPTSSVSHSSKTKQQKISEIWTSIYNAASSTQACIIQFSARRDGNNVFVFLCTAKILNVTFCLVRKHRVIHPHPETEGATTEGV